MSVLGRPGTTRRRTCSGCLVGLIVFAVGLILTWPSILAVYGHLFAPEQKSTPIPSPDGRYTAYVGIRGFMDSVHGRLYIREKASGQKLAIEAIPGEIRWSPDSKRVAVFSVRNGLFVYNLATKKSGLTYVKTTISEVDFQWLNNNIIALFRRNWFPKEEPMPVVAKAAVIENGNNLKVVPVELTKVSRGRHSR